MIEEVMVGCTSLVHALYFLWGIESILICIFWFHNLIMRMDWLVSVFKYSDDWFKQNELFYWLHVQILELSPTISSYFLKHSLSFNYFLISFNFCSNLLFKSSKNICLLPNPTDHTKCLTQSRQAGLKNRGSHRAKK